MRASLRALSGRQKSPTRRDDDVAPFGDDDLIIEIVSGSGLLIADYRTSDPYVKAKVGGKDIHETKHILKTLDPVYTPKLDSLFYVKASHLRASTDGLLLKVKDWDQFSPSGDELGTVLVSEMQLYESAKAKGKPLELKLTPPTKKKKKDAGHIMIKCRLATDFEETFRMHLREGKKSSAYRGIGTSTDSLLRPTQSSSSPPTEHAPVETEVSTPALVPAPAELKAPAPAESASRVLPKAEKTEEKTDEKPAAAPNTAQVKTSAPTEEPKPTAAKEDKKVELLVEIVSCRNLLVGDRTTSDPYVKVQKVGEKSSFHETKHVDKTLNPVFTPKLDSLFFISLSESAKLLFKVKDHDTFSGGDELGTVEVSVESLYDSSAGAQSWELKLAPPSKKQGKDAGHITLRCRRPADDTSVDKELVQHLKGGKMSSTFPSIDDLIGKQTESAKRDLPENPNKAESASKEEVSTKETAPLSVSSKTVDVVVEIVSCRRLLVADRKTSDPYVKVKMAKSKDYLHETKHIDKTLNPVYTPQLDSTFHLAAASKDLLGANGLIMKVKDHDMLSSDDLGTALVPSDALIEPTGHAMELKLTPPSGKEKMNAGYITIRCRPSSDYNDDFVNHLKNGEKSSDFPGIDHYNPLRVRFDRSRALDGTTTKTPQPGEQLKLLIEIVSCWDLRPADSKTSDPYVKVKFAGKYIHETKHVENTLNPVFTVKSNSLFILSVSAEKLYAYNGLQFKVKDHDDFGVSNDTLGFVDVTAQQLYESTSDRLEFELDLPPGKKGKKTGHIAFRCRPATDYDVEFLESLKDETGSDDFLGIRKSMDKMMKPSRSKTKFMQSLTKTEGDVKKYRVRPGPDPKREDETIWLTEREIHNMAMKESTHWLEVGTGDLAKIYLEVIGADGLPNKDTSAFSKDKTDAFVSIIYEDCMAKTDVIDDCLSPRWLPWTQRAFIFRMMHSSSQILLGIFDHDEGFANDHDMIGRVSVDLTNLRPNTEYFLVYNIYESAKMPERVSKGTVTIRLRIEIEDEKQVLLTNLEKPPDVYVNVKTKDDFYVVRKTVNGKYDTDLYSKQMISTYVQELRAYQCMSFYIKDAAINLLFWRGHFPLKLRIPSNSATSNDEKATILDKFTREITVYLPIHSFNAFIAGVMLVERPTLFPSFFFFGVAWFLLSVMGYRRNSPNPWEGCKSFAEFLQVLIFDKSLTSHSIAQHENEKEAKAFEEKWKARIAKANEDAAKRQKKMLEDQQELEQQMAEIGETTADTDISTKTDGGMSMDPFKPILYPIQQYLCMTCEWVRFIRNIIIWEECYITFLIVAGSLSIGVVFLFVPWAFLFRWTSRLLCWALLGPWMKLVDIYWYRNLKKLTEEEQKEQDQVSKKQQLDAAKAAAADARVKREEAAKLKDMKSVLYGKFVTKIPIFKVDRFRDMPLHTSMATPCKPKVGKVMSERVAGQRLVGAMIPKVQSLSRSETEGKGKVVRRPSTAVCILMIATGAAALGLVVWYVVIPSPALKQSAKLDTSPDDLVDSSTAEEL